MCEKCIDLPDGRKALIDTESGLVLDIEHISMEVVHK